MAEVVGVVFRSESKIYHFDPAGLELCRGDRVVVQTVNGPEIGQVVESPHTVDDSELPAPLKKVTRLATGKDLESLNAAEELRRQAMDTCRRLIQEHGLDMKLVDAEIAFGGGKITFSFVAEERVDFRALVADLAKTLKMRVELRQVGAREEAKLVGGLGPCGRLLCCTLFSGDEEPVSIRMAKEQNLPLNPTKISGLCGRLMCCLKYEQEQYVTFRKEAPPKGTPVLTPQGEGVVAGYNLTKESIMVRLGDGTLTNVRLSSCEPHEGGGLVVVPEVAEPVPVSWLDSTAGLETLDEEEAAVESLPVVEAEVVLGADGEPLEVIVEESSRPSRRSRRRRKRRSHKQGDKAEEGAFAREEDLVVRTAGEGKSAGARTQSQDKPSGPEGEAGSLDVRPADGGSETKATNIRRFRTQTRPQRRRKSREGANGQGGGLEHAAGSQSEQGKDRGETGTRPSGGRARGSVPDRNGPSDRSRRRRRPRRENGGPDSSTGIDQGPMPG